MKVKISIPGRGDVTVGAKHAFIQGARLLLVAIGDAEMMIKPDLRHSILHLDTGCYGCGSA